MSSIFKYFSSRKFLDSFMNEGQVCFNSLSYFMAIEDKNRRDSFEDSNLYKPLGGLQITKVDTQEKFADQRTLISRVKNPHRVFVFCTSTILSENLYQKFNSNICVEIENPEQFTARIKREIVKPIWRLRNRELLSGEIDYYDSQNESGARHACPDQIIMSKLNSFSEEKEYRFAFAIDKDALVVNNVDYSLTNDFVTSNRQVQPKVLRLGNLSDVCKIVVR